MTVTVVGCFAKLRSTIRSILHWPRHGTRLRGVLWSTGCLLSGRLCCHNKFFETWLCEFFFYRGCTHFLFLLCLLAASTKLQGEKKR